MRLITYDSEVFKYNWVVVFKDYTTKEYKVFHNNAEDLAEFISDECVYVGFNSKFYDKYIIKAICMGLTPPEIKHLNDYLIAGNPGWEYPYIQDFYFKFNNVDVKDDMQIGLSLKAIEGHLGLNIEETQVDFNIDRQLTIEELELTIKYCKHDVDCTEKILELRKDYLKNKLLLGKMAGLSDVKALSMTNAKLTSAMLKATKKPHEDEREYVYPDKLKREYIPGEVFEFFDRMKDPELNDKDVFSSKLEITIGECPVTIAMGGLHGSIPNYICKEEGGKRERIIRNFDVASYYPNLMINCGYTSRNIPSPQNFIDIVNRRLEAKHNGDKVTANALKLVVNTTYGAMLNNYNDLCDPLMGRSVCITGQLFLLEITQNLYEKIKGLRVLQVNTDGVMVEFDEDLYEQVLEIVNEWQERTGFKLEEDKIKAIYQKDVNNYIEIQTNGEIKEKGSYLVRGIATAGSFNVNNNMTIVATAIKEYLVNNTQVEETINNCTDIFQFQQIAKAGSKYSSAFQIVEGLEVPIQKVNRVYASYDQRHGTLYKVKAIDGSIAKIAGLPDHCIIDNSNQLTIDDIDKEFYINLTKKRINEFLGKEVFMATETKTTKTKEKDLRSLNIYQKLEIARNDFLHTNIKKSGANMKMEYTYFELADIVPGATEIFSKLGLVFLSPLVTDDNMARGKLINTENPDESIWFEIPYTPIEPIISNAGKQVTNAVQCTGATITYLRRYFYMMLLDIVEADLVDSGAFSLPENSAEQVKTNNTVSPEIRHEAKKELTNVEQASGLQIKQLKKVLSDLIKKDKLYEKYAAKIAAETKSFTEISKTDCEDIITKATEMLESTEVTEGE